MEHISAEKSDKTIGWSMSELATCTAYGKLYVVAKIVPPSTVWLSRVRKKKGHFGLEPKAELFMLKAPAAIERVTQGELVFQERSGHVTHLKPEEPLAGLIQKALGKVKVK
jgi:hypothetical protein